MKRYDKSHLIEAKYFIQDKRYFLGGSYITNSHGKRIVGASFKNKLGVEVNFSSYKELQAGRDLLNKLLKQTKGKWFYKKKEVVLLPSQE